MTCRAFGDAGEGSLLDELDQLRNENQRLRKRLERFLDE